MQAPFKSGSNKPIMSHFSRLVVYAKPYTAEFIGIFFLGILASAFEPGIVLGIKPLIDGIFLGKDPAVIEYLPWAILLFSLFSAAIQYFYSVWVEYLSERIVTGIRQDLYHVYTSLSLDYYSKASSGKMMSVMINDVTQLLEGFGKFSSLFREPFTILGLLAMAFYRNWRITLGSLILLPPLVYGVSKIGKRLRKVTSKRQEQWGILSTTVHETLSGIRIIKTFNLEQVLRSRFKRENNWLLGLQLKWLKTEKLSSFIITALAGVALALILKFWGASLFRTKMDVSDILTVGGAFGFIINPIKRLNALNLVFQKALGASERIFSAMELKPSVAEIKDAFSSFSFKNKISYENVSFKYENAWILKNFNFEVQKGQSIALVGSSGAGKTTIVNLLPRLYDVVTGSINIDGVNIQSYTLASLREQIAIVTQDVFLFNDTVATNIGYGKRETLQSEIETAAKAAHAHEFIMKLPQQYQTIIGERGAKLSGGERQRISIARALLKNAPILILDEATSALDTESEVLVQKAIERLREGRTCFMIAHRLSTIRNADRIIVLNQGDIVETGTHDELLGRGGTYFRFYQMQFSNIPINNI